jgi:short-subunit dehydrogenase
MRKVLIIGATSAIAEAAARLFAARGDALFLVARNRMHLDAVRADLLLRGAKSVDLAELNVNALDGHAAVLEQAWSALGAVNIVLIAHGTLPDQSACQASPEVAVREFTTNATSTIALATAIAARLEAQGNGTLAVISSVAGDRGRASNYLYGAAKAAVTAFLSGLRQRLAGSGVNVLTIKPGFVDTPMTAAFRKGALWASPAQVADGIVRAIDRRRSVVYLPGFWRFVMLVIRHIPEPVFKRVKL